MNVALAGEGAIGRKHAAAIARIEGVAITHLAGGEPLATERFAGDHEIPNWSLDLDELLARPEIDAVVLATPTPLHASQAVRALRAGKHVLVEIPMAESLADANAVVQAAEAAGGIAMVCHTRRFNPSHQWIHDRIVAGELSLQHLIVTTTFFRRRNRNALGEPRSWTDHLLWHHACHTVDLFAYQTGCSPHRVYALEGPPHPDLGIAMDMSIGMQIDAGALCSLALSFNHDGPFGTTFRYVCDNGTYVAHYDELTDGYGQHVDLSAVPGPTDGIERQDREFFEAVAQGREPHSSVRDGLPAMRTLDRLAQALA
jgi:2-hydroxy-4-carboxymuconate semialdehyde hemiacetal dehydrogenase